MHSRGITIEINTYKYFIYLKINVELKQINLRADAWMLWLWKDTIYCNQC